MFVFPTHLSIQLRLPFLLQNNQQKQAKEIARGHVPLAFFVHKTRTDGIYPPVLISF